MIWSAVAHIFSVLLELLQISRMSEHDKDLEILVLRYQLGIADRKLNRTIKPNRIERLTLAVLVNRLKRETNHSTNQLRTTLRLFSPRTVFRWHNELVKRKWTYKHQNKGGRPRLSQDIQDLVIRLAKENPRWGYGKIEGELLKLGIKVSQTTIRNFLNRQGIVPAPVRAGSLGWRHLMNHYKSQLLACDFLTVETLFLKTIYIFFFIEIGTRRVHIAGITEHPNGYWVAQQARNFGWFLQERDTNFVCLIRDNDSKYTDSFDTVIESEGINIIRTPFRAPNANAFAERWVRTLRTECLDNILVVNESHLRRVLTEYVEYYNSRRPHQSLNQQSPIPSPPPEPSGMIQQRKILGGIINDYFRIPSVGVVSLG
jgi:putative transposase